MQLDLEVLIPIRMGSGLAFPDPGIPAGMRDRKNKNQSIRFLYSVMYLVGESVHQNASHIPIANLTMQWILSDIIKP